LATQHDYYEGLCALAVSGHLATDGFGELALHMETCADCREALADFSQISAQLLPELAAKRKPLSPPEGMTARFIARAHSEGIPLTESAPPLRAGKWMRYPAYLLAASVFLAISLTVLKTHRQVASPIENKPPAAINGIYSADSNLLLDNERRRQQVEMLRSQVNRLETEIKANRQDLESARSEKLLATTRLAEIDKENTNLRQYLAIRDSQIGELTTEAARTKAQVEQLITAKANGEFQIETARSQLDALRAKVASLREDLTESQQLSAAAEQAKDLIIARKLHIVDVDDTDGNGRQQRPFGRIFYTEGRNLVFYAYDLADSRKLNAKINFYVWGSREGLTKPVRSLGIFHTDDEKDGRWVLKFDDPAVLAEINCVFVTAESSKKAVTQPTGHQILFASLGPKPNHP
jgi:hypothetical protein